MNIFLRFKKKHHSTAYSENVQLQLKKRMIMLFLVTLKLVMGTIVVYAISPVAGPFYNYLITGGRILSNLIALVGIYCLNKCFQRLYKHIHKLNIVFDILIIIGQVVIYPAVGRYVNTLGKLEIFVWAWSNAITCYSTIYVLANWWMKILIITAQSVFFLAYVIEGGNAPPSIVSNLLHSVALYLLITYFSERYQRFDFLERRKAFENHEAIKRIFDDISQGIMIIDQNDDIVYSNRTINTMFSQEGAAATKVKEMFCQIHLRKISPQIGMPLTEAILPTQDNEESKNTLYEVLPALKDALLFQNPPEKLVTVESYGTDPKDQNKRRNYFIKFSPSVYMDKSVVVVNVTDTTDRDSLIAAEASNEYKTRLLSSVSHELRTPLNGSINFIEEALNDPSLSKEIKERCVVPALRSNRLLLSLVNDILDFSQMHEGKLRLVFEAKNVVDTAKECMELLEIQAQKKNIGLRLTNHLTPEAQILFTDHHRLSQVILNLLSNAVKFTFSGEVELILEETTFHHHQRIAIEANQIAKGVKITCRDTGIGISRENQKKLFQAFEKLDSGANSQINATGAGLGLVISRGIVQKLLPDVLSPFGMDSIHVESCEGVGTSFSFEVYNMKGSQKDDLTESENSSQLSEKIDSSGLGARRVEALSRLLPLELHSLIYLQTPRDSTTDERNMLLNSHRPNTQHLRYSTQKIECKCPKVLIVDDDMFNINALELILSKLKLSSHCAFNGKQAVERIRLRQNNRCSTACSQYKVVFLDCNMPILDGFETARLLRRMIEIGEIDDMKLIACTAFVRPEDEDKARAAGMDDFCTKPINIAGVKKKLMNAGLFESNYA